MMLF